MKTALSRRGLLTAGAAATGAAFLTGLDTSTAEASLPPFRRLVTPKLLHADPWWPVPDPGRTTTQAPDWNVGFKNDAEGLPLSLLRGNWGAHPSRLGWYINNHISSFENTGNRGNLTRAAQVMDIMMSRAAKDRGSAFVKYEFPWEVSHGKLPDPWYSSFGQSQFPLGAERLYRLTGDRKYLKARELLLNAFFQPRTKGRPWIVDVDRYGMLWLEEYPFADGHASHVHNGQIYAVGDLLRYAEFAQDQRAYELVRGAIYTSLFNADLCRKPAGLSYYYKDETHQSNVYHAVHAKLYNRLYNMTQYDDFAKVTDRMVRDACPGREAGTLRVTGGRPHRLRKGSSTAVWKPTSTLEVSSSARDTLTGANGVVWSLMSSGPRSSWHIEESPDAYRTGYATDRFDYRWDRRAVIGKGALLVGYEINEAGVRKERRRARMTRDSAFLADARANLGGRQYIRATSGQFAGLWIPEEVRGAHFTSHRPSSRASLSAARQR